MNKIKYVVLAATLPLLATSTYARGNKPAEEKGTIEIPTEGQVYVHQGDVDRLNMTLEEGSNSPVILYMGGDSTRINLNDQGLSGRVQDLGKRLKELEDKHKPKPKTYSPERSLRERLDSDLVNDSIVHRRLWEELNKQKEELNDTQAATDSLLGLTDKYLMSHEQRIGSLEGRVSTLEDQESQRGAYFTAGLGLHESHGLLNLGGGLYTGPISFGLGGGIHMNSEDAEAGDYVIEEGSNQFGRAERFKDVTQYTSEKDIFAEIGVHVGDFYFGLQEGIGRDTRKEKGETGVRHVRDDGTLRDQDTEDFYGEKVLNRFYQGFVVGYDITNTWGVTANLGTSGRTTNMGAGVTYRLERN